MTPETPTVKLAVYLFTRLYQLGVVAVHGVPGDFNLNLLDYVEPTGLDWVGNANELNAGYAADGYARIKGLGALVTTSGVGELSAINAVAGSYAERAPVVHIVGTPSRVSQETRARLHHNFNDGDYRRFADMHAHVTVAQASLRRSHLAPDQIDELLKRCLVQGRPVYLEVPQDMVEVPVSAANLQTPIRVPEYAPTRADEEAVDAVLDRIYAAKQPAILVDGEIRPIGIVSEVQEMVKSTGWPTWSTSFGKSLTDETLSNFHGVYMGKYAAAGAKAFFESADLVLFFGPHLSSTNTYAFSGIPKPNASVAFSDTDVKVGTQVFRDVSAKAVVRSLLEKLDASQVKSYETYPDLPRDSVLPFSDVSAEGGITQLKFWRLVANMFRPGDIILGETGTAGHGCRTFDLPRHSRLFAPATWLSIGYMLPAAQGAAVAQRELVASGQYHGIEDARTVLFIGDGSFQMTAQELSTIIRLDLDVIVVLVNNDGYTIERCLHGLKEEYNDIAAWRYLQAPALFGARQDSYIRSAKTWGELETILGDGDFADGKGLRMVEVFMDREDAPEGILTESLEREKKRKPTV